MRIKTISLSVLLHVVVIVIFSIGSGWLWTKKELDIPPNISVEIIEVAEKTQTNKRKISKAKSQPKKKKVEKKTKPIKKSEKPAKAATSKSQTTKAPLLEKQDKNKKQAKKEVIKETSNKVLVPPKKKPPRKPIKKKTEPKAEQDFSSVLKNLADGQIKTEKLEQPKKTVEKDINSEDFLSKLNLDKKEKGHDIPLGTTVTISEIDLLRRQLSSCWNISIGARNAENLSIDIFMVVNSDRTVHHAKIVNQSQYKKDAFFRAAADSALRAVYNPECSPLELPPEKYRSWKEIIVTFDPQDMF